MIVQQLLIKLKLASTSKLLTLKGAQCSDFQAFIAEDLKNNLELSLDPTVTRSQMLASYPAPGTHDKFYNQNSVPLVRSFKILFVGMILLGWLVTRSTMMIVDFLAI